MTMRIILVASLMLVLALPANALPTATPQTGKCNYQPPLDVQSGAASAYSFRVLSSKWIGRKIVKIRRSSDSTTKDFFAIAPACTINTSDSFFDASTYSIVTWYDQSGNGVDVTQPTAANQPTVTLSCQNGHPCSVYTAANSDLLTGTLASSVSNATYAIIGMLNGLGSNTGYMMVGSGNSNQTHMDKTVGPNNCRAQVFVGGSNTQGTEACNDGTWYRTIGIFNSTLRRIYLNGTAGTDSTTTITIAGNTALNVGLVNIISNVNMNGDMSEAILFSPDLSPANALIISSNQGGYWGL